MEDRGLGPHKRRLAGDLIEAAEAPLRPGGLLHLGQGKWYPGEPLPRWALRCYWRLDGSRSGTTNRCSPIRLKPGTHTVDDARRFGRRLAAKLGVNPRHRDRRLRRRAVLHLERAPAADQRRHPRLEARRTRKSARGLARVFEQGITRRSAACCRCGSCGGRRPRWESGDWVVRADEMFLIPGDSPMGFRLPLHSLLWYSGRSSSSRLRASTRLPSAAAAALPATRERVAHPRRTLAFAQSRPVARKRQPVLVGGDDSTAATVTERHGGDGRDRVRAATATTHDPLADPRDPALPPSDDPSDVVRTALCVEPRGGVLHVFMPPLDRLEDYLGAGHGDRRHGRRARDAGRASKATCRRTIRGSSTSR